MVTTRVVRPDLLDYLEKQGYTPLDKDGLALYFEDMTDEERQKTFVAGWEETPDLAEKRGAEFGAYFNADMIPLIGSPVRVLPVNVTGTFEDDTWKYDWRLVTEQGFPWFLLEEWLVPAGEEA